MDLTTEQKPVLRKQQPTPAQYKVRRVGINVGKYGILLFFLVIFLVPFLWMWLSALKTGPEISMDPFGLPQTWQWENFVRAWTIGKFGTYIWNTIFYSAVVVVAVGAMSALAGYALAMFDFPARGAIFITFLLGLMIPFQSLMIPLFYLAQDVHILGTRWAFVFPAVALGLPFGIFMMRAFFKGLPPELADAAKVDGCGEFCVFWRVMLPLAAPGLGTLVVFEFMFTWNAFLLPLVLVQSDPLRPVALGMMFFFGRFTSDRGLIAAGVALASLPVIALYLMLQRQFIRGITAGAVK